MTGDGCGVDVVLSKWSYKGLQNRSETTQRFIQSAAKSLKIKRIPAPKWGTFPKMGRSTEPHVSAPQ